MSRVQLLVSPTAEVQDDLKLLVSDIINYLSFVTSNSELFKATSWPIFVAGADARGVGQQVQQWQGCMNYGSVYLSLSVTFAVQWRYLEVSEAKEILQCVAARTV
jgi:hypothetical protein